MITFVICEDEKILATEYKNEIDKFMMKYDHEYNCKLFSGYSKEFYDFSKNNQEFKIYLLDIKTKEGSGLDAARLIREEYDDWSSMIIIVSAYNEYKYDAYAKRLMLTNFINKLDKCKENLQATLEICMKHYSVRPMSLKYSYKNMIYNIDYKSIVYIEKEPDSKRCTIHLNSREEISYPGTINNLLDKLDDRFIKISRSTIINADQILKYNIKNNEIEFKNKEYTTSISRDKKRSLIEYVRGIN